MPDPRLEEMAQALERIRERVSARHPSGELEQTRIPLVDLLPLLHARDAAEAKVAAIGTVNPRPPGLLNNLIQSFKRAIARLLNWFVRDQVDFNRALMSCTQATLDSLNDFNRLAVDLHARAETKAKALADVHAHWIEWRQEWESKLTISEIQHLRAVGDLEASYLQRLAQQESSFRDWVRGHLNDFQSALDRSLVDSRTQLAADLQASTGELRSLLDSLDARLDASGVQSAEWRRIWEQRIETNENRSSRLVGDLETSWLQRLAEWESSWRRDWEQRIEANENQSRRLVGELETSWLQRSAERESSWRRDWEQCIETNDNHARRLIGDIEAAWLQRASQQETNLRDWVRSQQLGFESALEQRLEDIRKRIGNDLEISRDRFAADLASRAEAILLQVASLEVRLAEDEEKTHLLAEPQSHWNEWRHEWETKLESNEFQSRRLLGELEAAYVQRLSRQESDFRELVRSQHRDFGGALERSLLDIQKQVWADLANIRLEYDRLIHSELRLLRQRSAIAPLPLAAAPPSPIDPLSFGARFRGSEEHVKTGFAEHIQFFSGCSKVVDIGCGRGEFLELARERGIAATGIDSNLEAVEICRAKGLDAENADLFEFLARTPEFAFDGLFCAQVIEHLPPERMPELIRLVSARLVTGARVLFETPNPECLAIFATHFYLDPTHTRPIPARLLAFYLEEAGFGGFVIDYRQPADPARPLAATNALDYALRATKL